LVIADSRSAPEWTACILYNQTKIIIWQNIIEKLAKYVKGAGSKPKINVFLEEHQKGEWEHKQLFK